MGNYADFRRRQREESVASSDDCRSKSINTSHSSSSAADYRRRKDSSTDYSSPHHCRKRRRVSRCNHDLGRRRIPRPEATGYGCCCGSIRAKRKRSDDYYRRSKSVTSHSSSSAADYVRRKDISTDNSSPRHCRKRRRVSRCNHDLGCCGSKRAKWKSSDDDSYSYTSYEEQSEKRSRNHFSRSKIIVFWDRENCPLPKDSESFDIARNIKGALEEIGLTGDVEIRDYSDTGLWPHRIHLALTGQALSTLHVPPSSRKDTSDKKIITDLLISAWDNKESRTFFMLISSDADFAYMLSLLRMRNYPILLACNNNTSKSLIYNGDVFWMWKDIANGVYEAAFNQRQTFINYLNWDRELASIDAAIKKRRKRICCSY